MRTHENSWEFHICFPWIHHFLRGKALKPYQYQVNKSLYKSEIPSIAELKPIIYIFLTNAINKVTKEEPRRTNKKLLPFWPICKGNSKQRPCLILAFHLPFNKVWTSLIYQTSTPPSMKNLNKAHKTDEKRVFKKRFHCLFLSPWKLKKLGFLLLLEEVKYQKENDIF